MSNRKEKIRFDYDLIGGYVDRYNLIYLTVSLLVTIFELGMIIFGLINFDFDKTTHLIYFCSYVYLFVVAALASILMFKNRKHKVGHKVLTIMVHVYSFVIISWATIVSSVDMFKGNTPIVYLTITIVIAGIVVINPFIYLGYVLVSLGVIVTGACLNNYRIFVENPAYIYNFIVFIMMAVIMAFRQYVVCKREETNFKKFKSLSYTDQLTGLGNETLYFKTVDKIETKIKNGTAEFAIAVLDVNGIKTTNDTYGHRFGCNMIVTVGHTLPDIFKDCKLFHIGGDEFVIIIDGDAYHHLDEMLADFKEKLYYTDHSYEGVALKLSVAIGSSRYEKGNTYQQVFQNADNAMYIYKKDMKAKLGMKSR